ncbi:MAG TPA: F0F1 ATP synthase subunit gamma [Acidimicrobiia bacterium]|nr:F0F1 ATP synthase subunit gamma [Acidimicrobiia bacterium]
MAGGQERILRRRIRSVQATKKITRAMELIAASRIVKAQARVHAAQPYAEGITDVVRNLQSAGAGRGSALLTPREEIRNVATVVIAADRGLCGGYNSAILRTSEHEMHDVSTAGRANTLVAVGRKSEGYFRFREVPIDAAFSGFSDNPSYEDARAIAGAVVPGFEAGNIDVVQLVYTRFISAGRQEVVVQQLLPIPVDDAAPQTEHTPGEPQADYEFEPGPDAILATLLPRYTESRVYAALLNAAASEHAARQRAMKAATDNAEDLILTYTRRMNRARQDAITTEIMEIVGGAEALSQDGGGHHDRQSELYEMSV